MPWCVAAAWQAERDEEERLRQERAQVERERAKRRQQIRNSSAGILAAACAAILFGAIGLWWLDQRARAKTSETIARLSEGMARLSETKALENEKKAQENLSVACQGLDDWLTEVADVDLADIPQMERVRQRLLEKASKGYEKLARNTVDDQTPLFRWVVGRSHSRLGDILAMLGNYSKAEESYRQGIARLQDLLGEYPGRGRLPPRPGAKPSGAGVVFKDLQRYKEAQDELTAARHQQ